VFKERPGAVSLLLERGAGTTLQALNEADDMLDLESEQKRAVRELLRKARTEIADKVVRQGQDSASRIIRAAFNGDVREMEQALEDGESWWDKDEFGMDALAWASRGGHHEAVAFLMSEHPDPDREDAVNEPPLGQASKDGFTGVVSALIDAGVDVDHVFKDGRTALMHAAENGHLDIVRLLLGADADKTLANDGTTAYNLAMAKGHTAIVELLR
jgi:ankyrin repeat protein